MKVVTGKAGRRRCARHRNQTPRDSSGTFHLHRATWQAGKALGKEGEDVAIIVLPNDIFDALDKAKAAAENKKAQERDALRAQTTMTSQSRTTEEDGVEEVEEEVCLGLSTSRIMAVVPHVRHPVAAVRVLSIGSVLLVCSGTLSGRCR